MTVQTGQRFRTHERCDFFKGKLRVAKYLPEFEYRVTDTNRAFVAEMVKGGKAAVSAESAPRQAKGPAVTGTGSVKGKGKKK